MSRNLDPTTVAIIARGLHARESIERDIEDQRITPEHVIWAYSYNADDRRYAAEAAIVAEAD